ncbi:C-C motif chemokine 22 isoform X2 [Phascolarctos cinereus]
MCQVFGLRLHSSGHLHHALLPGPYGVNMESSICCNDFVPFPLPLKFLTRFHFTSATCRKHGVILLTMKNRKICADPRKGWVKHAITALKKNH